MAERKPLVFLDNNLLGELPAGDTLPVSVTWVNITGIPANITAWASIAPGSKADTAALADYLPLAGGTMTGPLTIGNAQDLRLDAAAGNTRVVRWTTGGLTRWAMYANATAESGSNAGSNFILRSYNDAGGTIGDVFSVNRDSRVMSFNIRPVFAGNTPWDSGNFSLENPQFGSTTDAITASKELRISSNGFAGVYIKGDASNEGSEPGGAYLNLSIDADTVTGGVYLINSPDTDGMGGSLPGTASNTLLIANKWNNNGGHIQFFTRNLERMRIGGNGVVTIGQMSVSPDGTATLAGSPLWNGVIAEGLGLIGSTAPSTSNLDTVAGTDTRFFRWTSSGATGAPASAGPALYLPYSASAGAMIAFQPTAQSFYFRTLPVSGSWNPWQEVWSTNNLADSGWQTLSYGSGWGAYTTGGRPTPGVRKFGNFVKLRGAIQQTGATGATIITLPAGYRPPNTVTFQLPAIAASGGTNVIVQSNGIVEAVGSTPAPPFSLDGISFYIN